MSSLYASLRVTPKKKRVYNSDDDTLTPRKRRASAQTPPATPKKSATQPALPAHLVRLQSLQSCLHHALSHSLATSAICPSESGIVPNVLNNHTLTPATGFTRTCTLDDLRQLCWLWEWDGQSLPIPAPPDDDPFLEPASQKPEKSRQWTRGAVGLVITPTTHLSKSSSKRTPAYGIGIEVEMDIDKGMTGGMAAVARWTAAGDQRMKTLAKKLHRWVELHEKSTVVPNVPLADLPQLIQNAPKQSALTQRLASLSPKSPKNLTAAKHTAPPLDFPPSPSRSSSPSKTRMITGKRDPKEFAIPFPLTPSTLPRTKPSTTSDPFKTPSTTRIAKTAPATPSTPQTSLEASSRPSTPVSQNGENADNIPATPTSARRVALYERIRKRSESQVPMTPTKARITTSASVSRDQLLKLTQEEMRRRCLLGRLGGVAESVWMYFASPANTASLTATPRKRRTFPTSEVAQAIIKSSPVPISDAEALESITLLTSLCPFFLKQIDVGGEDWLEMPATSPTAQPSVPSSPTRNSKNAGVSDEELRTLSPRRVKREAGGLREVRERIKRELEATLD